MLARPFHWLYALLFSYFWKRCERCGRGFGGHQWRGYLHEWMTVWDSSAEGHCAYCPRCASDRACHMPFRT